MKKIPQQSEVSIFISEEGDLCIDQANYPGETQSIYITHNNIQEFLRLIQEAVNEQVIE